MRDRRRVAEALGPRFVALYARMQDPAVQAATERALRSVGRDGEVLVRACAILHEQRRAVREERRAYWLTRPGTRQKYEPEGLAIAAAYNHRVDALRDAEDRVQRTTTVADALHCPDALAREAVMLALGE